MRELIRPTLFIVARLGLFFAVLVYIFGQTWQGFGSFYGHVGVIDRTGVGISIISSTLAGWSVEEIPDFAAVYAFLDGRDFQPDPAYFSLHVVAIAVYSDEFSFGIRHWFLITIFALFYGVLKWVYRKRGKELVADE